eukprot:2412309-Lingulodinium_polyedra.AAC.1
MGDSAPAASGCPMGHARQGPCAARLYERGQSGYPPRAGAQGLPARDCGAVCKAALAARLRSDA